MGSRALVTASAGVSIEAATGLRRPRSGNAATSEEGTRPLLPRVCESEIGSCIDRLLRRRRPQCRRGPSPSYVANERCRGRAREHRFSTKGWSEPEIGVVFCSDQIVSKEVHARALGKSLLSRDEDPRPGSRARPILAAPRRDEGGDDLRLLQRRRRRPRPVQLPGRLQGPSAPLQGVERSLERPADLAGRH
jgi:hypothetical protein